MESLHIQCPDCGTAYVITPDNRGVCAQCSLCSAVFLVPRTGDQVELIAKGTRPGGAAVSAGPTDDAAVFQLACPTCGTAYRIPESYRGNQGECGVCGIIFRIPATGNVGIRIEDAATVGAPPQPTTPPSGGVPAAPPPGPAARGIQPEAKGKAYSTTNTMALSRAAMVENTMKPRARDPSAGPAAATAPAGARPAAPRVTPAPTSVNATPAPAAVAAPTVLPTPPTTAPPAPARPAPDAVPQLALPPWLTHVKLNPGEKVLSVTVGAPIPMALPLAVSLLPVALIPVAVYVSGVVGAAWSAGLFAGLGAAAWALFAFGSVPALRRRRAAIVTNHRAILVDGDRIAASEQPTETP